MNEKNGKHREAERHLTEELANQAKQEPGSAADAESKERRAQAEKELQDAKQRNPGRSRVLPGSASFYDSWLCILPEIQL
jgi:hypothetical protein